MYWFKTEKMQGYRSYTSRRIIGRCLRIREERNKQVLGHVLIPASFKRMLKHVILTDRIKNTEQLTPDDQLVLLLLFWKEVLMHRNEQVLCDWIMDQCLNKTT